MNSILIVGAPRSGTSWIGKILSVVPNTVYFFEPDNEKLYRDAYRLKKEYHRFPFVPKKSNGGSLARLWDPLLLERAFPLRCLQLPLLKSAHYLEEKITRKSGQKQSLFPSTQSGAFFPIVNSIKRTIRYNINIFRKTVNSEKTVIVKSVHSILALQWLIERYSPKIIIVLRHPGNIIASYCKLEINDGYRNIKIGCREDDTQLSTKLELMAAQLGSMYRYIGDVFNRYENIFLVKHEDICRDAIGWFEKIFSFGNLTLTKAVIYAIQESNSAGEGMELRRKVSDLPEKYLKFFGDKELSEIRTAYCAYDPYFYYEDRYW